jgi:hypothetical protein
MRKRIVALGLLCPFVAPAAAQSIGGNYTLEGTNLNGSPYDGWAEITLTSETTGEFN